MRTEEGTNIQIVEATERELLFQAYRLRYAVAVEEMKQTLSAADHARRLVKDELDNDASSVLCAVADGEVVGTLRLTWAGAGLPASCRDQFALGLFQHFPPAEISITSRLAVDRNWRATPVLGRLFNQAYALARARGVRINLCHCAPALVRLYEQIGYRRYAPAVIDPDIGYSIPLLLLTEDLDHLRHVGSPLLRIACHMENSDTTARWFASTFPQYQPASTARALRADDYPHTLAESLFETGIPLFRGLAADAVQVFIESSPVLKCAAGEAVVRQGDIGNEMFLILSGAAEVRRTAEGREYTVATLGDGEIFGEMAFLSKAPRTASVVAIAELEVLVLSQHLLKKLMKTLPQTTMQVLFNLAIILCGRLNLCTERLLAQLSHHDENGAPRH